MTHPALDPDTHIAVVGMAGRFPKSADVAEFWRHCVAGDDCVSTWDGLDTPAGQVLAGGLLEDPDQFDAAFFGMTPNDAELLDPQHRVFLQMSWHALESAAVVPGDHELVVSVYASAAPSGYRVTPEDRVHELDENERYRQMLANTPDFLATRVSHLLDLRGEAVNVQTACSSSLVAVHMAVHNLRAGLSDVALAGGISLDPDQNLGYPYQEGMIMSPDGRCRPFDASANGTVHGYGGGVVVLQRLGDALEQGRPIHAVIRATATNNDGKAKTSFMAPTARGQSEVIATALALADVPAESIGYFEAHGTGTLIGDPIEIEGAQRAYELFTDQQQFCALGSLKSNFGHLGRAAGIAGLIKAVCAVRDGVRPPLFGLDTANPGLALPGSPFRIPVTAEPWADELRRAAVSSFGVGGTNAHAIVESFTPERAEPCDAAERPELPHCDKAFALPVSAPTRAGLTKLANALVEHPGGALPDIAHTLAAGRMHHPEARAVVVGSTTAALREVLPRTEKPVPGPLVFAFPGQAGESSPDLTGLYHRNPVFRAEIDACAEVLGTDGDGLLGRLGGNPYQPALVAVEIAYARLLNAAGVHPAAYVGSSLGEYAAAHLAGVFERDALMRLLDVRDRLMRSTEPGTMLSVACSADEVADLVGADVALAADNASDRIVLSGAAAAVDRVTESLTRRTLRWRALPGVIGFHSAVMDPVLEEYTRAVEAARPRPATAPIYSTLHGDLAAPEAFADTRYWVRHLREQIRFAPAVRALLTDGYHRFVEAGPGTALTSLVQREATTPISAVSVAGGFTELVSALSRVWHDGEDVNWDAVNDTADRPFTRLPGYPFAPERFWRHAPRSAHLPRTTATELASPLWTVAARSVPALPDGRVAIATGESGARLAAELAERLGERAEIVAPGETTTADVLLDLTQLGTGQDWRVDGLVAPTRTLLAGGGSVTKLLVVTRDLFRVRPDDALSTHAAAVLGLVRCAPHDFPGLSARVVDIDDPDTAAPAVLAELGEVAGDDVAYRGGTRYTLGYRRGLPSGPTRLRAGGTYLVLGGTGRLGAVTARAISDEVGATVLLAGRTTGRPASKERAALLRTARTNGSLVREIALDVTDTEAVRAAVGEIIRVHGRLDGVVHLAGDTDVTGWPLLEDLDHAVAESITHAKVRGAQVLSAVLADVDCDFVVLFSSISSVLGGLRFGAYVSGNAYLDALASAQHAAGRPWISAAWDMWSADGETREDAIGIEDGVALLRDVFRSHSPLLVAAAGSVEGRRAKVAADLRVVAAAGAVVSESERPLIDVVRGAVAEVTGRAPEDPHTNLSRMGVDSLQMMQIAARLRATLDSDVSLAAILRAGSIDELVTLCATSGAATRTSTAAGSHDGLSTMQQRLWYLWQLDPDATHYNVPFGWRLPGVDVGTARAAVAHVLERHPALRTAYRVGPAGEPTRVVRSVNVVPVETAEFPADPRAFIHRPFDLPDHAVRVQLVTEPDATGVLFVCHHLATDAWSVELIRRDLVALTSGQEPTALPDASYDDFVEWETSLREGSVRDRQVEYWQGVTAGLRVTSPPADPNADAAPGQAQELWHVVPAEVAQRLRGAAAEANTTLYTVAVSALSVALSEWCRDDSVVVGTNLANRNRPEFESVVGMFVDPVVLRMDLGRTERRMGAIVDHVREVVLGAIEHSDIPYQDVVRESGFGGADLRNPLFSVIVTMFDGDASAQDDDVTPLPLPTPQQVKFDLSVEFLPRTDGLAMHVLYAADRYRHATVERFATRLAEVLAGFADQGTEFRPTATTAPPRDRFAKRLTALAMEGTR